MRTALRCVLLALSALLAADVSGCGRDAAPSDPEAEAQRERLRYVEEHYRKREVRIPMRDGVTLFTAIYTPRDPKGPSPILMQRTPYSVKPYGEDKFPERGLGPSEAFVREGFIFVAQDVRGRFMSEGEFVNVRPHRAGKAAGEVDESTDTWDTIAWLLANVEGHNGRVGQLGVSYPGFYTSMAMIDAHPALKAVSPQAPIADWFWDDMHRHGAFVLPLAFNFFATFGQAREGLVKEWPEPFEHGTPDGYQFFLDLGSLRNVNDLLFQDRIAFWNEIVAHPNYDAFWQERSILPHLHDVRPAVLTVGGWYDTEDLYGPLKTYATTERENPGLQNSVVLGPWSHGGWRSPSFQSMGDIDFGQNTSEYFREHVEWPFFRHHLQGGPPPNLPEALVFETGSNRWRGFNAWPPVEAKELTLYMQEGGRLAFTAPTGKGDAFDSYVSDPAKPVPYTEEVTAGWAKKYMVEDQRFASRRPDVLVYQTEPLEEDLTLAGPVEAELWVSTTGTDADWVVKVIDVHPGKVGETPDGGKDLGGYHRLVRAEAFRGRFRESYAQPAPFEPDTVTRVRFTLWDQMHTFKKGHRIMVHVQSTWFPFIDRNPQSFVPNIFEADELDFVQATHRVHRDGAHPSHVTIRVLPAGEIGSEVPVPK
ncbi:CocE/NonD family hydrolase [Chondromyces apiculatus]|uniref:Hydrolase, CocE/NonD family n=1 Tax=Chondromyces apiculatus DSM 436 TaxID=1192034 RepID=A0A017SZW1_9BACT|nr:CocE/NonD family hydrolase [Chondromyces apiculatus]EYF02503.1 Hydrolase, CocE/NonD family [Chondromyces apiculatus DSM 436]